MSLSDPNTNSPLSKQPNVLPDPFPNNPPIQVFLPFSNWLPFFIGAVYGFLMRLIYKGHNIHGAWSSDVMSISFAIITPLAVGAITVYFAERERRRNFTYCPVLK